MYDLDRVDSQLYSDTKIMFCIMFCDAGIADQFTGLGIQHGNE